MKKCRSRLVRLVLRNCPCLRGVLLLRPSILGHFESCWLDSYGMYPWQWVTTPFSYWHFSQQSATLSTWLPGSLSTPSESGWRVPTSFHYWEPHSWAKAYHQASPQYFWASLVCFGPSQPSCHRKKQQTWATLTQRMIKSRSLYCCTWLAVRLSRCTVFYSLRCQSWLHSCRSPSLRALLRIRLWSGTPGSWERGIHRFRSVSSSRSGSWMYLRIL